MKSTVNLTMAAVIACAFLAIGMEWVRPYREAAPFDSFTLVVCRGAGLFGLLLAGIGFMSVGLSTDK